MEYEEDDDDDEELLPQNFQLSIYLNPLASCIDDDRPKIEYCCY